MRPYVKLLWPLVNMIMSVIVIIINNKLITLIWAKAMEWLHASLKCILMEKEQHHCHHHYIRRPNGNENTKTMLLTVWSLLNRESCAKLHSLWHTHTQNEIHKQTVITATAASIIKIFSDISINSKTDRQTPFQWPLFQGNLHQLAPERLNLYGF